MRVVGRLAGLAVLLLACGGSVASAQGSRVRGPFTGLFGGGRGAQNSQSLNFRGSLFGVWQDVVFPADVDPTLLDPRFDKSSTFGGAVASLDYAFNRRSQKSGVFVAGRGWAADYSVLPKQPQYGAEATTGISHSVNLTRRMVLQSNAGASYSPYFNLAPLPFSQAFDSTALPVSITPGLGVGALNASNVNLNASVGVSQSLSRRSSVSANLSFQQVYFLQTDGSSDLTQLGSQALYHYQIFKKLSFHAGYQRSQARIHNPDRWSEPTQYLDFGLDYGDALSLQLSRRTLLTFGVSLGSARAVPGTTQYRVLGNANLSHSMGRTWSANVGVARSLGFVAAFQQPVLSDAAFASIGGQLATRVSSVSTASWTRGYIGLDSARHFDSSGASSVLSVGVTRRIGAFAQYSYYRNRLPTGATTLAVLSNFDRQTASVGLTFYAPLYNSQRNR